MLHFVWEKMWFFFADDIDNGDTLYVLKKINQELCAPANERVNFVPHYDTIVKGGLYEYYASEGQNPLRENAKKKYDWNCANHKLILLFNFCKYYL